MIVNVIMQSLTISKQNMSIASIAGLYSSWFMTIYSWVKNFLLLVRGYIYSYNPKNSYIWDYNDI